MRLAARLILFVTLMMLSLFPAGLPATFVVYPQTGHRPELSATEVFVAIEAGNAESVFGAILAMPAAQAAAADIDAGSVREFLPDGQRTILTVPLMPGADPQQVVLRLAQLPGVAWAAPNRIYNSDPAFDPREYTPDDPLFPGQYHHQLMQTPAAWDVSEGAGMLIAIFDDGFEITHEDLQPNIWVNDDPPDGIDNDGNGYVDDTHGWNVVTNTADLNPGPNVLDGHGMHVAGIAAARTNNNLGVSGTAGKATLLPVKFFSRYAPWTSAMIAEALRYATDNGARITNMSYRTDALVGDPIVTAAFDYAYDRGVLMFNSAGNDNRRDPERQAFTQVLFVANTNQNDQKYSEGEGSNYGIGIDIAAPGTAINSIATTAFAPAKYRLNTGTSMAAPNAAGVAALIWAANPAWTRDQVAAQLLGTVDSIDAQNPLYVGLLGAGRVNAARAVSSTFQLPPPQVGVEGLPSNNATLTTTLTSFTLLFPDVLSSTTVTTANLDLRSDGADGIFGNDDDIVIPLTVAEGMPYQIGDNRFTFQIGRVLPPERYRFTARSGASGIRDPFGQQLDGDGNGIGGDDFTRTFTVGYQLYGFAFEDWNNNAVFDADETPIWDIPIFLDLNGSTSWDVGEPRTTSDQFGLYIFAGVTPVNTTLRLDTDLISSTPVGGSVNVTIGAADADTRLDVGLYRPNAIYGIAFDDTDGDGIRDGGETGLPNWPIYLDGNQNGIYDPAQQRNTYTTTADLPIPDNNAGGVTSTLVMSGIVGLVRDLNVTLSIGHTYIGDLRIDLIAPDGRRINLIAQRGDDIDGYANLTLDDEAAQAINSVGGSPASGAYRPEEPLSTVDFQSANGEWKLVVSDRGAADFGTLQSWSLDFETGDMQTVSSQSGRYQFTGLTPGSYTIRQDRQPGWLATTPISESYVVEIVAGNSVFVRDFGNRVDPTPPEFVGTAITTTTFGLVESIVISFSKEITGLTLSDIKLFRNGMELVTAPEAGGLTLSFTGTHAQIGGLAAYIRAAGSYELRLLKSGGVRDLAGNPLAQDISVTWYHGQALLPLATRP